MKIMQRKKRIGLLISEDSEVTMRHFLTGYLREVKRLSVDMGIDIVIGASSEEMIKILADKNNKNFSIRKLTWLEDTWANIALQFNIKEKAIGPVVRPSDGNGGYDYLDCDIWVMFGVPRCGTVAPIRPYYIFSCGFPERYLHITKQFGDEKKESGSQSQEVYRLLSFRVAQQVVGLTVDACLQINEYAGATRKNISLLDFDAHYSKRDEGCKVHGVAGPKSESKCVVFLQSMNWPLISKIFEIYSMTDSEHEELITLVFVVKNKLTYANRVEFAKLLNSFSFCESRYNFEISEVGDCKDYASYLQESEFKPAFLLVEGCGFDEILLAEQVLRFPGVPLGVSLYSAYLNIEDEYGRMSLIDSEDSLCLFLRHKYLPAKKKNLYHPRKLQSSDFRKIRFEDIIKEATDQ